MKINIWKINMYLLTAIVLVMITITAIMTRYSAIGVMVGAGFTLLFMLFMVMCNIMVRLDEIEYAITQTKV